jgi:ketosteroid isomerase-like protein
VVTGTLTPKAGGERASVNAKEIGIFRREPDGAWRLWRLIGNSNSRP